MACLANNRDNSTTRLSPPAAAFRALVVASRADKDVAAAVFFFSLLSAIYVETAARLHAPASHAFKFVYMCFPSLKTGDPTHATLPAAANLTEQRRPCCCLAMMGHGFSLYRHSS